MGHPDGAHTHGSGGDGLGTAVLVLIGAALAVKLAGPVLAAVAELLHVFLIVAGVIVGVGAASLVGLLTWRWRRTQADAARAMPPLPSKVARAAQPLPKARPAHALPTGRQRELPGELHLHFHGVPAEEIAAAIRQATAIEDDRRTRRPLTPAGARVPGCIAGHPWSGRNITPACAASAGRRILAAPSPASGSRFCFLKKTSSLVTKMSPL